MSRDDDEGATRVLHLDDDRELADLTATFLEEESEAFEVLTAYEATEALERLESEEIDAIVSDYEMPGLDGLEFLAAVREDHPNVPFILFTGMGSEQIASEAISQGVTDYLQKQPGNEQYTVLANRIQNAVAQHEAEREVEERSEWYSRILAHSSDYVLIVDEMGKVSYASPAIERVMGYTPEAVIGNDAFEFVHPEDLERAATALAETIENADREVTVEFRSTAKDGTIHWLEVRGSNLLEDRLINGVMVNVRDITERKEREQELRRQQAFLEHSSDIITVLDEGGTIDYVTPAVESVLGYEPEALLGTNGFEHVHPADTERVTEEFAALLERPDAEVGLEFRYRAADGEYRWLDTRGRNRLDDDVIEGVVINARDVTARREREQEIEWQNERLEEFTKVVSHDLRNPLDVAEGRLELLRREVESEHIDRLDMALGRMNDLIEDLMQLAREGEEIGSLESVDLAALVDRCWHNVATSEATIETDVGGTVRADPTRLQQLVENLLGNAVDHAGEEVAITVGELPDGFYVEDDGPGIPADDREDVFDAGFSTADAGNGFGLTIVKQVAKAHGWTVAATEGADGGARFEVTGVEFAEK